MKSAPFTTSIRRCTLFLTALCTTALPGIGAPGGQDTATREFQRTLTLGAGQTFSVQHKFGEVRIHSEGGREVKINANIRAQAGSQAEAEKFADQIRIEVSQDTQGIKVKTVYPDDSSGIVLRIHKSRSYSVDYDIAVPGDTKLWIKNGFGNVDIRGVHGWADVENSHGQLVLRDGGAMKLTNSFGSVEASGAEGSVTVVNTMVP